MKERIKELLQEQKRNSNMALAFRMLFKRLFKEKFDLMQEFHSDLENDDEEEDWDSDDDLEDEDLNEGWRPGDPDDLYQAEETPVALKLSVHSGAFYLELYIGPAWNLSDGEIKISPDSTGDDGTPLIRLAEQKVITLAKRYFGIDFYDVNFYIYDEMNVQYTDKYQFFIKDNGEQRGDLEKVVALF